MGVIAAGVTLFGLFGDSAEDAATKTSKFTESANEASSKVESLVSILKTAKEGSKVYKDTIKELSSIYSNYGITIDRIKLNVSLAKHFFGKLGRWAIAIDPSYISKAGKNLSL